MRESHDSLPTRYVLDLKTTRYQYILCVCVCVLVVFRCVGVYV